MWQKEIDNIVLMFLFHVRIISIDLFTYYMYFFLPDLRGYWPRNIQKFKNDNCFPFKNN